MGKVPEMLSQLGRAVHIFLPLPSACQSRTWEGESSKTCRTAADLGLDGPDPVAVVPGPGPGEVAPPHPPEHAAVPQEGERQQQGGQVAQQQVQQPGLHHSVRNVWTLE